MIRRGRRLVCALACFALSECSRFDGHVENLPSEIQDAISDRARESSATLSRRANEDEEIVVGKISILNQTVLPANDFFAPLFNSLHFVTQPEIIRAELDFKEGDKIRKWQLYDAERYVRLLSPIKQAQIFTKKNPETNTTDVTIVTQDTFSPQFRSGAEGSGGYYKFAAQVYDPSVLGRLYSWDVQYTRENFRDYVGLGVGKARIDGTRWQTAAAAKLGFANSQYNYLGYGVTLDHPFTRQGQRHALTFSAGFVTGVNYDYLGAGIRRGFNTANGQSFDLIYRTKIEDISAQYLYGLGRNDRVEFGAGLMRYVRRDYYISPLDQYSLADTPEVPVSAVSKAFYQSQQYSSHAATFSLNTRNGNFTPMKNFQRYLFTEDEFEGLRTSSRIVHANPTLGLTDHYTSPATTVSYQKNFLEQLFRVDISASRAATLWHSGYSYATDDLWLFDLRGYYFTKFGTLALRGYISEGYHLTRDKREAIARQFTRGFNFGSVYPSAGHLTSVEYRSPGLKLPYILVAGALFFDYAGVGDFLNNLIYYPVAGVGIRSMWHEFDNNVFRIDVGVNLDNPKFNLLNALQFGLSHTF